MISEHFLELADVRVVQLLENCNFAHKCTLSLLGIRLGLVCGYAPNLALLDHLDGEPLASGTRDGLHNGGERPLAKFMANIIERVYASLSWTPSGVSIDEA